MIWLWRICSSLLAAGCALAGAVSGKVELRESKNPAVTRRADYSGVVVWLEPVDPRVAPGPVPRRARMVQKDKTFTPHVLAIETGAVVDFPNYDPIFHNAFSNYDGEIFDVGLYPPGTSRSVTFKRPGVVRVFCNIHSTMSALIVVVSTPYFDTTPRDGSFQIAGVPSGEYRLRFFHERATEHTLNALDRRITVGSEGFSAGETKISEAGYLPVPHKNKYGVDYPPAIDDPRSYAGAGR